MCAATAVLVACQKNESATPISGSSTALDDVTPRIQAFIDQSNGGVLRKDNTTISRDSAEWYIEAALNMGTAEAWRECNDYVTDSLVISIPTDGSGISSNEATIAYLDLELQIRAMITPEEEHLVFADVEFEAAVGGNISTKVLLQFGSGYDKTGGLQTGWGANDYWFYGGFMNSTCGCGSNVNAPGSCADLKIQGRVNAALALTYPCYFTNLETRSVNWVWSGSDFNYQHTSFPTGIPATPYKLYYCNQGQACNNCLSPSKMTFYTQGAWDMMQQIKPASKRAASVSMSNFSTLGGPNAIYSHAALYSYGVLNCPRN